MKKSHKNLLIIALVLILLFVIFNLISIISKSNSITNNNATIDKNIEENIDKIKNLEESSIKDTESIINEIQKNFNSSDNNIIQNSEPSINYKEIFSSSVIMGDSQSEGLIVYGILNSTSVIAKKGGNLSSAKNNNIGQLKNLSPSNIFILYGMNDILIYQDNIASFINDYTTLINEIKKVLPTSTIFVNSILPVADKVIISRPIYKEISNYNIALEKMCNDLGITYINSNEILINNTNLFEADGMHLKPPFYNKWLDLLRTYI